MARASWTWGGTGDWGIVGGGGGGDWVVLLVGECVASREAKRVERLVSCEEVMWS